MKSVNIMLAASLLYAFTVMFLAYGCGGVHQASLLPLLGLLIGTGILWLGCLILFVVTVQAGSEHRFRSALHGVLVIIVGAASPFVVHQFLPLVTRYAEIRDLRALGISSLRREVLVLTTSSRTRDQPTGYFGSHVPTEALPPLLRQLSASGASVETSMQGVFIVTDGLGSWRGGYLITPVGTGFIPEHSTLIEDGVFYVTAR